MRTTLSAALTRAMKEELVQHNVARLVEFSFENKDADNDAPWSPDEVQRFLKAADGDQPYPARSS